MAKAGSHPHFGKTELLASLDDGSLQAFLKAAQAALDEEAWASLASMALEAHQSGRTDLVAALGRDETSPINHPTQRFIGLVLPEFDLPVEQMAGLITTLSSRSRGKGIPHNLHTGFSAWLERDAARPAAALAALETGRAPADLLNSILFTGLRLDAGTFLPKTIGLLRDGTTDQRETAAGLLGRFDKFTPSQQTEAVEHLERALSSAVGADVTALLRALLAAAVRSTNDPDIGLRALSLVAGRADAHVREAVSLEMMFDIEKVSDALAIAALAPLHDVETAESATINAIDHILSHKIPGRLETEKAQLLDAILARRIVTMSDLQSTGNALLTGDRDSRDATIRRWLTSEKLSHFVAVRDICGHYTERAATFDLDFSGLSRKQAERVARRSCVVLVLHPETVASILASLMRTGPADAVPRIEALLFDPLLVSYWNGPRAYLESILPDAPAAMAASIQRVLARHDQYKEAIEATQTLRELRPSQHQRFLVELQRREQSRAIDKSARSQSFIANLFPTSVLLYGDSAIYDMHLSDDQVVRQETPMQTHEFSQEIPRLEVIDPFGSWFQRERLLDEEEEEA